MGANDYVLSLSGTPSLTSKANAATAIGANGIKGMLAYDATNNQILYCNDTNWVALAASGGLPAADSLDFTEFKDAMTLDASTDIAVAGTNVLSITNTGTGSSFVVNDVASDTTPFVIDASGNVGIGTTGPQVNLDVAGVTRLGNTVAPAWPTTGVGLEVNYETRAAFKAGGSNASPDYATINANSRTAASPSTFTGGGQLFLNPGGGAVAIGYAGGTAVTSALAVNGNVGIGTTAPGSALDVKGTLRLSGSTSGYVGFAPAAAAGSTTYTLPAADGSNGQQLTTNGSGVLSWAAAGGGGSAALSGITAATTGNTIANGANAQVWNWALTGSSTDALTFGETTAATGGTAGDQSVLKATTLASSTATPLIVTNLGNGPSFEVNDETGDTDTTPFLIDASGNVGIGTATPTGNGIPTAGQSYKLHVAGSDALDVSLAVQSANDSPTNNPGLVLFRSRGTLAAKTSVASGDSIFQAMGFAYDGTNYIQAARIDYEVDGAPGTNDMPGRILFKTTADGAAATTERMRIDASGNVGIGISAPANELDVVSTSALGDAPAISIRNTSGATPGTFGPSIILDNDIASTDGFIINQYADATARFGIAKLTSPWTEYFTILQSGRVGIGTGSPGAPFDVNGTPVVNGDNRAVIGMIDTTPLAANVGGGLQFGGIFTSGGSTAEWAGIKSGKTNATTGDYSAYLAFMTRTNGSGSTERMRIDNVGNVGIGTPSPGSRLDVKGTMRLSGSTSGYVGFAPAAVAGSTTYTLPTADGTNGQQLTTNGAGVLSWAAAGGGGSAALSGLTAATATNTIDSLTYAQTWNWSTATTQNPMTLTANAMTTGSLLSLTSSSTSINSTNGLLYVANTSAATNGTVARITANSTAGSGLTVQADGDVGIGVAAPASTLQIGGNRSLASWTTTGAAFSVTGPTFTDTSSAAAATIATRTTNSYAAPVFTSTNAITVTDASTLYIAGAPTAGANTTITNPYAVQVATGQTLLAAGATIGNTTGATTTIASGISSRVYLATGSSSRLGIGTTTPSWLVGIIGNAAQTIGMERHTTANIAGSALTLSAGGATSAATDKNGGNLFLASGIATGTGSSAIQFQTSTAQGSTNTTDNAPTTKMTLTGAGNLGIGTTGPTYKLQVTDSAAAQAAFYGYTTAGGTQIYDGEIIIGQPGFGSGRLFSRYVTGLYIDQLGGYPIYFRTSASSTPATMKLSGTAAALVYEMDRHPTADTAGGVLTVRAGGATTTATDKNGGNLILASGIATGTGTSAMYFQTAAAGTTGTADNAPATRMTILGSGNVGIGTTTPNAAALLDLTSTNLGLLPPRMNTTQRDAISSPPAGLVVYNTSTNTLDIRVASAWSPIATGSGSSGTAGYLQFSGGSGAFASSNTTAGQQLFWDSTNHRLGLGTTTPAALLSVGGNRSQTSWTTTGANLATLAATYTDNSSAASTVIATRTVNSFASPSFASTNAVTVTDASTLYVAGPPTAGANTTITNAYALHVATGSSLFGGNVGVGTAAPGSTLDVKGTLRLSGSTSGYVGFAPAAAAGSTTYTLPSADGANGQQLTTNGSGVLSWAAAGGGGAAALSGITAATATNTIANSTNAQTWNWALTGATADAFTFGETSAATGGTVGDQSVLKATTLASSTATPLIVTNLGNGPSFEVNDETGDTDTTPFAIDASGNVGVGTSSPGAKLEVVGAISSTGGFSGSEVFGKSATIGGTYSTAFGNSTAVGASNSVAVGWGVTVGTANSVAVGYGAGISGGTYSTVIGSGAVATGAQSVVVGGSSSALGAGSTTIGYGVSSPANSLRIGWANGTGTISGNASGYVGIAHTSPGSELDVKGTLRLSGSTSGYVGLAPAAAAGSTTYTLPAADGSNGQVLSTNGSGALSWATASSGSAPSGMLSVFYASACPSGWVASSVVFTGSNLLSPPTLLMNGNGTNGSTTFVDSSSAGRTLTAYGNAQISTTQSKFGGASMYFDGSGDYVGVPESGDIDFGSGDFTIDMWVNFSDGNDRTLISGSSGGDFMVARLGGALQYGQDGVSWDGSSGAQTWTNGTWYHIAIVRSGGTIRMFKDGTQVHSASNSTSYNFASPITIGRRGGPIYMYGYIDDLRIIKGSALWTSGFTPPTSQLDNTGHRTCQKS